jgi:uncharacterized coiled-coil protein SlyX
MSNLEEEVFGGNTTLWSVLDTQGVPALSESITRLESQLYTLSTTVDRYQSDVNAQIVALNSRVTLVEANLSTISLDVSALNTITTSLNNTVTALAQTVNAQETTILSHSTQIASLNSSMTQTRTDLVNLSNRIFDLEHNRGEDTWVRYDVTYSVTEWPFWQTGFQSYQMIVRGTGTYVPLNRLVTVNINGTLRQVVWGIAFRDIPPNAPGGDPAPLMEGLASCRFSGDTSAALCYINKTP